MIFGIALTILIAIGAYYLSSFISVGTVTISIILGVLVVNIFKLDEKYSKGIKYSEKSILAFAIALMGINLDFSLLTNLGINTIILIALSMVITIYLSIKIASFLKIDKKLALLIGIGNGVCGASAISATKNIIKAKDDEVGISIAIVNLLGTIGIFIVPAIALLLGFNEIESGILVGNTLQAVGQVLAGGFSIGENAGQSAVIVKMTRVLMLTPLILILLFILKNNIQEHKNSSIFKNIPIFIIGFLAFSIIASLQILPENIVNIISNISKYALVIAMAGIGLKITFSSIKTNGKNALILASIIFVIQILCTSLYLMIF